MLALLLAAKFDEALDADVRTSEASMPTWVAGGLCTLVVLFSAGLIALKVPGIFSRFPETLFEYLQTNVISIVLGVGIFVLIGVWGMRRTWAALVGIGVAQVMIILACLASLAGQSPRPAHPREPSPAIAQLRNVFVSTN
jgi:hypothetical protein